MVAAATGTAGAALFACGGSTSKVSGGSNGDSGMDALVEGSADATMPSDSGADAGADTNPPPNEDSGPPAEAGPATCASMTTRAACVKCCEMEFPDGGAAYESDLDECACAPSLCGPSAAEDGGEDGGAVDAEASDGGQTEGGVVLGTGSCAATCSSGATADPECNTCRQLTLRADGGACYATVRSACEMDKACKDFDQCAASCPKK